jgi:hypothetical protein
VEVEDLEDDPRHTERRLTDKELEACIIEIRGLLPKEAQYINGSRKRTIGVTALVGAAVGITTLIQVLLLNPITDQMRDMKSEMIRLDNAVRLHHESASKEYVLKSDYDSDMARLLSELSELKGMVMHMGQVRGK